MSTLWGVIIGGLLTIAGQGAAELIKARVASKGREDFRDRVRRKFNLDALEEAEAAAITLHDVLIEYQSATLPGEALEGRLRKARSAFDAAVPRIESVEARSRLLHWRDTAIGWVNDDSTAAQEQRSWAAALDACGQQMRSEV